MVSIRNYFTILILIIIVFVMFMFAGISSNLLSDTSTNIQAGDRSSIGLNNTITAESLNMAAVNSGFIESGRDVLEPDRKLKILVFSTGSEDMISQKLIQWCVYNKYRYKVYNVLPDIEELKEFDVVLFGDCELTDGDIIQTLYDLADMDKIMIFTKLPAYRDITADKKLAAFFGIKAGVATNVTADGLKIFSGFMISKERVYQKGDYFGQLDDTEIEIPYYSLSPGYEVYSVGIFNNQDELAIEDKDLPPLLWRTTTRKSSVYVVNSELFRGITLLGVLTGFMAHQSQYYVYPIINAQTISLINYPYFSEGNNTVMQQLYSRTSEAVARDLLWPNIIQILKNYGGSYNFFAAPKLDYQDESGSKSDYLKFYLREIGKLPGNMGLSLGQVTDVKLNDVINQTEMFFQRYLPAYDFTALFMENYHYGEIEPVLNRAFFKNISLIMSDYKEGENLFDFINNNVLSVKFNLDGYRHETMDDLQMISIENALGMCNMRVDFGRVFYPQSSSDEWNNLSLKWSKGDTYFKEFSMLDMVSVYEMENRIRRFLSLDYNCDYNQNYIRILIDGFEEEAFFILNSNNKKIDYVENGSAVEISNNTYLIKAKDAEVRIYMIEENVLMKPKNNIIIPSNPQ